VGNRSSIFGGSVVIALRGGRLPAEAQIHTAAGLAEFVKIPKIFANKTLVRTLLGMRWWISTASAL